MADLSGVRCDRACFAGSNVDQMSIKSASICGAFFKDLKGFPVELDVENLLIAANCSAKRQAWTEC
jgi:hypothetical protein|tara:strand:- start:108 stop:305 length:198 start_codon:yes stop_codon:yes gene_type:complete